MEELNAHIFYGGGGRDTVYQALLDDVLGGKALIKLTGREGSGKTLLCHLVYENLPDDYDAVYIDNPIGSFDDLLRIVCLDLGMHPTSGDEQVNFVDELRQLVEQRRAKGRNVLLVIDEAEKLFLATLERLVRTICSDEANDTLSILLSGRPGLDANLEQLSIFCANVDINAGYTLLPLTEEETIEYMMFRLEKAGLSREKHAEIFSEGALGKIFTSSRGNMRLINILAEESLQNSFSDKSFMVLLDHVAVEEDVAPNVTENKVERIKEGCAIALDFIRANKVLSGAIGAAVALIIIIGLLLTTGGSEDKLAQKKKPAVIISSSESAEQQPDPPVFIQETAVQDQDESIMVSEEQDVSVPEEPEDAMLEAEVVPEIIDQTEEVSLQPVEQPVTVETEDDPNIIIEPLDTPAPEENQTFSLAPQKELKLITVGPEGRKRAYGEPLPTVEIQASPPVLEVTTSNSKKTVSSHGPAPRKVKEEPVIINGRDGQQLFRERRRASATWLAEAYHGAFTVQLMMLSSNQAEMNLMKMLTQNEYFEIKNKLYILRKKTTPPTLFVYYGIYDSMDQARDARNSMPVFLRKHHPYALSINDALKKSED